MGARSGGSSSAGGMGGGDFKVKITEIKNVESLKAIKDPKLYKEMKAAISRFHAVLGIPQRKVKLADLKGAYGVHVTENGKSEGVYLNKKLYKKGTAKSIAASKANDYKTGWATKTNKPVAHTVTHELAHATWNSHLTGGNQKAAGKAIKAVYKKWSADKKKKGYGQYSHTNVNEFFAETVTKGIHGKSDKYTKSLFGIIKKYKL